MHEAPPGHCPLRLCSPGNLANTVSSGASALLGHPGSPGTPHQWSFNLYLHTSRDRELTTSQGHSSNHLKACLCPEPTLASLLVWLCFQGAVKILLVHESRSPGSVTTQRSPPVPKLVLDCCAVDRPGTAIPPPSSSSSALEGTRQLQNLYASCEHSYINITCA